MKPKTLTIHKDVWKSWKAKATPQTVSAENDENYVYFREEWPVCVYYHEASNSIWTIQCSPEERYFGYILLGVL